ncbi:MAG: hypothetical protein ABSA02_04485 [Trebonia sp.]|jgi:hypothetical protein
MPSTSDLDGLKNQRAKLIESVIGALGPEALADPSLPDVVARLVDQRLAAPGGFSMNGSSPASQSGGPGGQSPAPGAPPADGGLADLIGLGATAPADLAQAEMSPGVVDYDDTVTSDRLLATADLYYQYVHERLGVFDVIFKLQELFRAGTIRISDGRGAVGLYRFDKHAILRYDRSERLQAYKRVLGYGPAAPSRNARPNQEFHGLFTHFIGETAKFWRDKRISEVIRDRANDPTFASMALAKRAALDLRNNIKNSSYGYVSVMRTETSQALAEAFAILDADDLKSQFGAQNPWEMIELVMWQHFHRAVAASAMNRMAVSGRSILQWLAQPHVLTTDRRMFEAKLYPIAEAAEEWLSSDEGMRLSRPTPPARGVYQSGPPPAGSRRDPIFGRSPGRMPAVRVVG